MKHFDGIRDILNRIGERVEGNLVCDIHPDNIVIDQNVDKIFNLQHLVKAKQRVCEIGVNAGHSLLLMLEVNPTASYTLFDIGWHAYTRPCMEYICDAYPDTSIDIVYGDSKETLPLCTKTFDLIHVDGGHHLPEVTSDYHEAIRLIEPNSPIVFDDYDKSVVKDFLDNTPIVLFEDDMLRKTNRHLILTKV